MSNASQAINSLDRTINSFKSRVDVKVNDVNTSTANIQATTNRIYENIEKFKTEMLHGEEKQIAHENILRIDQIIKEQFSNHIAIRRTVMGVVRDFDINLVRNSTIQELSEELWITSSRYWLSYALIAITAWVNNYPDVAKNALAESGRKDAIKTTLFFCLMNMRFGRMDAAKKWFYEYFKTLDPTMLQQETAILLQSFLNGIFGKDKELEQEVIQLIDEWISIINDNEQISNELLDAYEKYIANLNTPVQFTYQSVLQFCTNASEVEKSYKDVSKFEILLEFVKSLDVESEPQDSENYKSRIDAILMNLISNYDGEELELKNSKSITASSLKTMALSNKLKLSIKLWRIYQTISSTSASRCLNGQSMTIAIRQMFKCESSDSRIRRLGLRRQLITLTPSSRKHSRHSITFILTLGME